MHHTPQKSLLWCMIQVYIQVYCAGKHLGKFARGKLGFPRRYHFWTSILGLLRKHDLRFAVIARFSARHSELAPGPSASVILGLLCKYVGSVALVSHWDTVQLEAWVDCAIVNGFAVQV